MVGFRFATTHPTLFFCHVGWVVAKRKPTINDFQDGIVKGYANFKKMRYKNDYQPLEYYINDSWQRQVMIK